ncbi:MAG: D-alanyl-D-alanine carboxypeptidase/D-alanyl-D-alanine-endopeptidase (penicillin-binding protein 4) [Planctomycetota bacterium]|jgi:D-alanyl-D-alanine carboxypeptidase/D-alanyl-D-alanine-endopeptidase (penicillin-binding protein 4)
MPKLTAALLGLIALLGAYFWGGERGVAAQGEPSLSAEPKVPTGFFVIAEEEPSEAKVLTSWGNDPVAGGQEASIAPAATTATAKPIPSGPVAADALALDTVLQSDLEAIIGRWFKTAAAKSRGKLKGPDTQISVHVRELSDNATLASVQGTRILRPASNLKVATSAAGLVLLGAAGQYETAFEVTGSISSGTLRGDLIVHAGGDPLVRDGSQGATEGRLDEVADALIAAGIRRISGDLILNEGSFLEPGIGPSWPSSNQHWDDYCALAAGLTVNAGVLVAEVTPRAAGAKASIAVHPSPHGLGNNYAVSTLQGNTNDVRVGATASKVTVKGKLGTRTGVVVSDFAHPDPVGLFGAVLKDRLRRAGISLGGKTIKRRGPPPVGDPLFVLRSPVADSLVPINTHSNNGVADQLFFTLGHRLGGGGTRKGAASAIGLAFKALDIDPTGHHQVDGSGLSRDNRISPVQLTGLLQAVLFGLLEADPLSRRYLDSLAVAGQSGTLATRFRATPAAGQVFAKTGFIDGTSSLSGIAISPAGRGLVFSIIVNYPTVSGLNTSAWKPMQDEMVLRILRAAE